MIIVGVDYHPSEPLGVKHFLFLRPGSCSLVATLESKFCDSALSCAVFLRPHRV
jgi:hypothetical protein